MLACVASAADSIRFLPQSKVFVLDAGSVTYSMGVNERNELQTLHFGARLWRDEDLTAARLVLQGALP